MKLPKIPFLKKAEKSEYFLSLLLRDEKVSAVIFEKKEGKANLLGEAQENFPDTLDKASFPQLLDILDRTISKAEETIPDEDDETLKTIFGLKETWVEGNKIKKEYLEVLKKCAVELGLKPIGFLVIKDAIINLIQKEEGAPVSAVLAEIRKDSVNVSIVKASKIIETKSSPIHETASFTVDALLKHLENAEILPARVIIFGGNEELAQEFISHEWSNSLPFLHLPQVINLPSDFDARAVLVGSAMQMGAVLESLEKPQDTFEDITENKKKEEINESIANEPNLEIINPETAPDFFGFIKDKDVLKIPQNPPPKLLDLSPQEIEENIQEIPEEMQMEETEKKELTADIVGISPIIKKTFTNILKSFKTINIKSFPLNFKGKKIIIIPAFILAVAALLFILTIFLSSATIILNVNPKFEEKNENVTLSISSKTDIDKNILSAEIVEQSEEGSDTGNTTGKKETGDKAKGTVTIFNQLSESQTLSKGTVIKSPNDLKFTLDDTININGVASHSADIAGVPVTKNVNVTASDIGKESNLPSGTKFSVANYSTGDLVAKNDNAFSRGTKKEITIVSKDDQDALLNSLKNSLIGKAQDDIRKGLSQNKTLLDSFINTTTDKKSFDKEIGGESSKINLSASFIYEGLTVNDNDLFAFALSLLGGNQLTIDKDNLAIQSKNIKSIDENNFSADFNIKAKLLPKINEKEITSKLAGKSESDAKNILLRLPQVTSVEIKYFLSLPFINSLPKIPSNIKITINSNG